MKNFTSTLYLILMIATLLSTISIRGMLKNEYPYTLEEYKQQAWQATEHNDKHLLPDETLRLIFGHCKKEGDIWYLKNISKGPFDIEAPIAYSQIKTLLALNLTCKHFNKLMLFPEVIKFCKTLKDDVKNQALMWAIPNIDKNYNPQKYNVWDKCIPKMADNYDNNLICSVLIQAGGNPDTTYAVIDKKRLNTIKLSVISQAIKSTSFLVKVALKHRANQNTKDANGVPLFFYVKTRQMAEMFVSYGCDIHATSSANTNVLWHVLGNEYPPELLIFYLERNVNLLKNGQDCIVHDLIYLFKDYYDHNLLNEFLEKCKILLRAIPQFSKNSLNGENNTLLDTLKLYTSFKSHIYNHKQDFQEFQEKAITLFKEHGCFTANGEWPYQCDEQKQTNADMEQRHLELTNLRNTLSLSTFEQNLEKSLAIDQRHLELANLRDTLLLSVFEPLMNAIKDENLEKVRTLLESGNEYLDINGQDDSGNTPLIYATMKGNNKIVKILLKYDADRNLINKLGLTALDIAMYNGNDELADLLLVDDNQTDFS